MQLRSKMVLTLLPLSIIPLIILGIFAIQRSGLYMQKLITVSSGKTLAQISELTHNQVNSAGSNLEILSRMQIVKDYLLQPGDPKYQDSLQNQIKQVFSSYCQSYPEYTSLLLLKPNGKIGAAHAQNLIFSGNNVDASETSWFKMAKEQKNQITTSLFITPRTQEPKFALIKPMLLKSNDGYPYPQKPICRGYIALFVHPKHLLDYIQESPGQKQGYSLLMDNRGRIISHPQQNMRNRIIQPQTFDNLKNAVSSDTIMKSEIFGQRVSVQGRKLIEDLWVLNILPEEYLSSADRQLKVVFTAITLATIIISSLLLYFGISRLFLNPVSRLAQVSQKIGRGNLDIRLAVTSNDEFGTLFTSFNRMVEDIKLSKEKIQAHQSELEQEVQNRTLELYQTNQYLQQEIDERKQAQKELIKAKDAAEEASRAKSEFLASISHEIRTPMNSILGMCDLLSETGLNPEQKEYLQVLNSSGEFLLDLINDILDFSKMESNQLDLENTPFDLLELTENVVQVMGGLAGEKGLELNCRIQPELHNFLYGDPVRIRQILVNLISNGIKFTHSGEVALLIDRAKDCLPKNGYEYLQFKVMDTGIGIDPSKHELIFDSFSQADSSITRKYGGTGLGLAICKKLVQLMGGSIWVESTPGKGSSFYFNLALKIASRKQDQSGWSQQNQTELLQGISLLIVDDNQTNREMLHERLTAWGATVETASNGKQALDLLSQSQDRTKGFAIVMLDQYMPEMDGIKTAKEIKRLSLNDQPLLIFVFAGLHEDPGQTWGLDIASVLHKPIKQKELLYSVYSALGRFSDQGQHWEVQPARSKGYTLPNLNVLIAEDIPPNRKILKKFLQQQNITIKLVENGQEAVKAFRRQNFDLVLMDLEMPVLDGLSAIHQIRELEKDRKQAPCKILALTAHILQENREKCIAAGCDDFLAKPVKKQQLLQKIMQLFPEQNNAPEALQSQGTKGQNSVCKARVDKELSNILPDFFQYVHENMENMHNHLQNNNYSELYRLGHGLKGAARNYSLDDLGEMFYELEKAAAGKEYNLIKRKLSAVQEYLSRLEIEYI